MRFCNARATDDGGIDVADDRSHALEGQWRHLNIKVLPNRPNKDDGRESYTPFMLVVGTTPRHV